MEIRKIAITWNPSFSIFASEFFLKTTGAKEYGWLGGFIDEVLCFLIPYFIRKKLIFIYMSFSTDTIILNEKNKNLEVDFLDSVINYFKNKKIDFIFQPQTNVIFNTIPKLSIATRFGTYQINLSLDIEYLWKNVHSKHRNVIRNAEKNGIRIEHGIQYKDQAYIIIHSTLTRSSINFIKKENYDFFLSQMGNNVEIFIAFQNEKPQCASIMPYSHNTAYYLWAGNNKEAILGSMNLLVWNALLFFKQKGVKIFDLFGARINPEPGSKLEGIQRFKERFGSEMRIGYLWKYIYNPLKYYIYIFLARIKSKNFILYKGDIIDQELNKKVNNA